MGISGKPPPKAETTPVTLRGSLIPIIVKELKRPKESTSIFQRLKK
jgi:hypothetical protein